MSNYPDGMPAAYKTVLEYRCHEPKPGTEDLCWEKFEVDGVFDLGSFEPNDDPVCPECGSHNVEQA